MMLQNLLHAAVDFMNDAYPSLVPVSVAITVADGRTVALPIIQHQKKERPKASVNARILEVIHKHPESIGWSIRKWGSHLGCSTGGIVRSRAWRSVIMPARAIEQAKKETHNKVECDF